MAYAHVNEWPGYAPDPETSIRGVRMNSGPSPNTFPRSFRQQNGPFMVQNQDVQVKRQQRWSWASFTLSIILFPFCPLFGTIGMVVSSLAYTDYRHGLYERFRYKRSLAWGMVVSGFVFVLAAALLGTLYYFLVHRPNNK